MPSVVASAAVASNAGVIGQATASASLDYYFYVVALPTASDPQHAQLFITATGTNHVGAFTGNFALDENAATFLHVYGNEGAVISENGQSFSLVNVPFTVSACLITASSCPIYRVDMSASAGVGLPLMASSRMQPLIQ